MAGVTATEASKIRERDDDERSLHRHVQWFTEKWSVALDLNKRDASEFAADFLLVVQAIHRDAGRETQALLMNALGAIPPQTFVTTLTKAP